MLVLALQLLIVHVHKVLVSLPGRAISSALKILQVVCVSVCVSVFLCMSDVDVEWAELVGRRWACTGLWPLGYLHVVYDSRTSEFALFADYMLAI